MKLRFPQTVILANGSFPTAGAPLEALRRARRIVCCDGAADKLAAAEGAAEGLEPAWVVGDLDSLSPAARERFAGRLAPSAEQETNDLSKAFRFCVGRRWRDIAILGATGGREDHALGNLSLLVDFARESLVAAFTDEGVFTPVLGSTHFSSFPGQPVSVFSFDPSARVYSEGLKYALESVSFTRWWKGTLNEAEGEGFNLVFEGGPLLVFRGYGGARP